jgi:hypothetical protein
VVRKGIEVGRLPKPPQAQWSRGELEVLQALTTPGRIQAFLDTLEYSADPIYRCPRSVLRDRKAHCFDGATFAAAALKRLGLPPLLIDLRSIRDDDHVLALFRRDGYYGAVGKSNFVGLRFREPIHRTLRELVLSYFEVYYNVKGEKTLRAYSRPVDLDRRIDLHWETDDAAMDQIAERLDTVHHDRLLTAEQEATLEGVDDRALRAGLLGANPDGLYKP